MFATLRIVLMAVPLLALPARAVDLMAAWAAAEKVDPAYAAASASRDAAAEGMGVARARLLPQLTLQHTHQALSQETERAGGATLFSGRSVNTQLSLRQGLFRPRERLASEIARLQFEYSEARLLSAQADLRRRTATSWIEMLAADERERLLVRASDTATLIATQEQARVRNGEGTSDALAEALAQQASASASLAAARQDRFGKRVAFGLLTGLDPAEVSQPGLPLSLHGVEGSMQELWDRIQEGNPDLNAGRVAESIARSRELQASADHLPTLDLLGSVNRAENDNSSALGSRYQNSQVGFQMALPIFAGGGLDAAQRQAAAAALSAFHEREAVEKRIKTQLAMDWSAQLGAQQRSIGATALIAAAREQHLAVVLGAKLGMKTAGDIARVDQLLANREVARVDVVETLLKIQSRLVSLLPMSDPAWSQWTRMLAEAQASSGTDADR